MAYSHTFHIKINGIDVDGELDIADMSNPKIMTRSDMNMDIAEFNRIGSFLNQVMDLCKTCGSIEKVEILQKP